MSSSNQIGQSSLMAKLILPMTARSSTQSHRAATPLELLYDLVSVVAIAAAATGLHHAVVENHISDGLITFTMAFFSIWWAWMNFTWFASAYDNDDAIYRIAVLIMMSGSLCLAAGIADMFSDKSFFLSIVGYVIMRIGHVGLLVRAGLHNRDAYRSSLAFALGVFLCQVTWILGFIFVPPEQIVVFFALMVLIEFAIPATVSKFGTLPWHVGHIVERYGLLTIIVLGESLLSLTFAIQKISKLPDNTASLAIHIVSGLVSMFALWWLYFGEQNFKALEKKSTTFFWGYSHVIIFASIAAFGAGLAINLDFLEHHAKISALVANASLTIPAAAFLMAIWLVHERYNTQGGPLLRHLFFPLISLCILASSYLPMAIPAIALLLIVAVLLQSRTHHA